MADTAPWLQRLALKLDGHVTKGTGRPEPLVERLWEHSLDSVGFQVIRIDLFSCLVFEIDLTCHYCVVLHPNELSERLDADEHSDRQHDYRDDPSDLFLVSLH